MQSRINKELSEIQKLGPDSFIGARLAGDGNKYHWKGWIKGPDDSPYEGGTFIIDIVLPSDYPFAPPVMKFETHIWHPNVSSVTGTICLDTLKDEWSPALTIRTALLSVQALLTAANPGNPQDGVVAKQYLNDYKAFEEKAREWTKKYALQNAAATPVEETYQYQKQLENLVEMGFSKETAKGALNETKGDVSLAIAKLTR